MKWVQRGGAARSPARAALVALVLASAALCARPAPAHAQSAAQREQARARFERAIELINQERWHDALIELEAAHAIRSTPAVLFNLGLAHRALGHARASVQAFRDYLARAGERGPRELRARAQGYIAELGPAAAREAAPPARPRVEGEAAVAAIHVDGALAAPTAAGVQQLSRHAVDARPAPRATTPHRAVTFAAAAPLAPPPRRGVLQSPWFWTGAAAVVVTAGLIVGGAVLLSGTEAPYRGSLGVVTDAVTARTSP